MKKIFFAFPSNRAGTVNRVKNGSSLDNELYGLNHLKKFGFEAEYSDVYPPVQRILDLIFSPLYKLFQRQIDIGFHLGRAILLLLKMNRADIIITNTDSIGLPVCLLKRLGFVKPPVIYAVGLFYIQGELKKTIDSGRQTLFRRFYVWILSAADHVIYHSPIEREKLIKLGLYNPSYCTFVAMGSDAKFFKHHRSPLTAHRSPLVLAVGRDHARDYQTLFLVADRLPELNFVVICSQRNVEGLEMPKNIKVLLDLSYQEVADWYQKATVIVIPMREMHRSSGQMTLTDSFQAGKAIVASDVLGIRHYGLINRRDALLVLPKNSGLLKQAISQIVSNDGLRQRLSKQTEELAKKFTTENYAKNIVEAVDWAIDRIRLLPLEEKELEFLRRLRNENSQYFLDSSYVSKQAHQKWFENYCRKTGDYMFILEDKGKSIGAGAIYNIDLVNKTAEVGRFAIDGKFKNQGLGKILLEKIEKLAFKELGLRKLRLEVFSDNKIAINLYKTSGFGIEKVFKSVKGKEILLMVKSVYE